MRARERIAELEDRVAELEAAQAPARSGLAGIESAADARERLDELPAGTRRAFVAGVLGLLGIGAASREAMAQSTQDQIACEWLGDQDAGGHDLTNAGHVDAAKATIGGTGPFSGWYADQGDFVPAAPAANGAGEQEITDVDSYSTDGYLSDAGRGIILTNMPVQSGVEDTYYIAWATAITTDTDGVTVTVRARDDTHDTAISGTEESTTVDIAESPKILTHTPNGTISSYDPAGPFQFNFEGYTDDANATVTLEANSAVFPLGRVK